MRYATKDKTFQVRQVTEAELIAEESLDASGEPEFRVSVSRIASGWWTRQELTVLRDRLSNLLDTPVARQRFGEHPWDAAYDLGYLSDLPERLPADVREAGIAAMLRARRENPDGDFDGWAAAQRKEGLKS